jgi:hypothetical protein
MGQSLEGNLGAMKPFQHTATHAFEMDNNSKSFKEVALIKSKDVRRNQDESSSDDSEFSPSKFGGSSKKDSSNTPGLVQSMFDHDEQTKFDWHEIFLEEKTMGEPQSIPQGIIYRLINETINKDKASIKVPKSKGGKVWYVFCMPLTHSQYITIPDPLSDRNDNYYPLTLFMSTLWIFGFAYVIVWFTYDLTLGLGWKFSYIPMFIYPIGVSVRDVKKFKDFLLTLERFREELTDQEISLAESYSA